MVARIARRNVGGLIARRGSGPLLVVERQIVGLARAGNVVIVAQALFLPRDSECIRPVDSNSWPRSLKLRDSLGSNCCMLNAHQVQAPHLA